MMESKSLVWDYFEKLPNGKSSCKTCRKELPCTSGNTSGLGRHLNIYHQKLAKGGSARKRPREDFFKPHIDKELQDRFDEALIEHITETCTSFRQYGESFQKLIRVLSAHLKVKDPSNPSRMVSKGAEELLQEISNVFKTVKDDLVSLGFTTDLWTSRALHSYISLTVSFIDRFVIFFSFL